jgi:quercetin dioxygenase-like cupin family protein
MSTNEKAITPIALKGGEGEALWFLDFLATIKSTADTTNGAVSVIEHLGRRGAGSPMHVHHNEDEWWYVLDGELTIWVAGQIIEAPTGSFVFGPRHVPHTFMVSSDEARFLHVTEPGGFETFMRAFAEPARSQGLPPMEMTPPDLERLLSVAAEHGIEVLGPPGIPQEGSDPTIGVPGQQG